MCRPISCWLRQMSPSRATREAPVQWRRRVCPTPSTKLYAREESALDTIAESCCDRSKDALSCGVADVGVADAGCSHPVRTNFRGSGLDGETNLKEKSVPSILRSKLGGSLESQLSNWSSVSGSEQKSSACLVIHTMLLTSVRDLYAFLWRSSRNESFWKGGGGQDSACIGEIAQNASLSILQTAFCH